MSKGSSCPVCKAHLVESKRLSILFHFDNIADLPILLLLVALFGIVFKNSFDETVLFFLLAVIPFVFRARTRTVCGNCEAEVPTAKIEGATFH